MWPLQQVGEGGQRGAQLVGPGGPRELEQPLHLPVLGLQPPHVRLGEVAAQQVLLGAGVAAEDRVVVAPGQGEQPRQVLGGAALSLWPAIPFLSW